MFDTWCFPRENPNSIFSAFTIFSFLTCVLDKKLALDSIEAPVSLVFDKSPHSASKPSSLTILIFSVSEEFDFSAASSISVVVSLSFSSLSSFSLSEALFFVVREVLALLRKRRTVHFLFFAIESQSFPSSASLRINALAIYCNS